MLRKILLVVGIVAALAAAVMNFTVIKSKIDILTQDRNTQRDAKVQAQTELASTKKTLKKTEGELAQTKTDLATSEAQRTKLSKDLDVATTQIQDLTGKLAKVTQDRDNAQDQLAAYKATGKSPQEVLAMDKVLKNTQNNLDALTAENAVLTHEVTKLNSKIAELTQPGYYVVLPAALKGKVMAVDPKWEFVVLNVGEDQGVLPDGEMLVSRDGKLVAKVIVRSVQKNRCIANIVPGWQLGDIIEGDSATPAHPAT